MYSVLLICPYFGKFPKYQFPLWLKSCSYNPTIDWLIITDDTTNYDYPQNVRVEYSDWNSFKHRIQSVFDFPVSLEQPYKICDYRPAFGEIFRKEIDGYDFWGYTDCSDTIYGNLRRFLTEEVLAKSEKVMYLGHFSIYRNTLDVNQRYKLSTTNGLTYRDVFSTAESMIFDEIRNHCINRIFKENNFVITDVPNFCFDITQRTADFTRHVIADDWSGYYDPNGYRYCILWKKGKLFSLRRQGVRICKEEIGYTHFQKRKMMGAISTTSFLIVPNEFVRAPLIFTVFHSLYYIELRFFYRKVCKHLVAKFTMLKHFIIGS